MLEFMWSELNLTIEPRFDSIFVGAPAFAEQFMLPSNAPDLVRSLTIFVPMATIANGNAQKLLSEFMGNTRQCLRQA
ncbi:hypothetical protein GGI20_005004 [Coemansia sp. BCRC 34301]|nr:hypothetical protein GGI20_005004 [Coemansia sp. BCRC 34301]